MVWVYQSSGMAYIVPNGAGPGKGYAVPNSVWTKLPHVPEEILLPEQGTSGVRFTNPLERSKPGHEVRVSIEPTKDQLADWTEPW